MAYTAVNPTYARTTRAYAPKPAHAPTTAPVRQVRQYVTPRAQAPITTARTDVAAPSYIGNRADLALPKDIGAPLLDAQGLAREESRIKTDQEGRVASELAGVAAQNQGDVSSPAAQMVTGAIRQGGAAATAGASADLTLKNLADAKDRQLAAAGLQLQQQGLDLSRDRFTADQYEFGQNREDRLATQGTEDARYNARTAEEQQRYEEARAEEIRRFELEQRERRAPVYRGSAMLAAAAPAPMVDAGPGMTADEAAVVAKQAYTGRALRQAALAAEAQKVRGAGGGAYGRSYGARVYTSPRATWQGYAPKGLPEENFYDNAVMEGGGVKGKGAGSSGIYNRLGVREYEQNFADSGINPAEIDFEALGRDRGYRESLGEAAEFNRRRRQEAELAEKNKPRRRYVG